MGIGTIANRYARALADVLIARREVDQVSAELETFASLQREHEQLRQVFASPIIPVERKRAVLDQLIARFTLRPATVNFLRVLGENDRLRDLDQILRALRRELDLRAGIVAAEVTTARQLAPAERELLGDRLRTATGKEVRLHFRTDPEIIGGVVTRVGGVVFDGSIRNQLAQFKQRLALGGN
jgi:F-type H+-transporting ATPase subunit delta